ncbi:MAG: hypothetical protein AAFP20_03145 [Cyanobacteria bacterium J06614_10]
MLIHGVCSFRRVADDTSEGYKQQSAKQPDPQMPALGHPLIETA